MLPYWVSSRGGNSRDDTVCVKGQPLLSHAEWTEAGPGQGAGCLQNRFDARKYRRKLIKKAYAVTSRVTS
jgi:hypothetical protein